MARIRGGVQRRSMRRREVKDKLVRTRRRLRLVAVVAVVALVAVVAVVRRRRRLRARRRTEVARSA